MDAVHGFLTVLLDLILSPLEAMGVQATLIVVSGIFGILALVAFKYISWQGAIKGVKDRIKGHMIAIRIYQDDLRTVSRSVAGVLTRNVQYLALNFGPMVPLFAPFALILAQLVVRFAFAPIPVQEEGAEVLPGGGTMITVQLDDASASEVAGLEVVLPDGVRPVSDLFTVPADGRAFLEVVATAPGDHELLFRLPDGRAESKRLVAGDEPTRTMQPERVSGFWVSWLWPAEPTLPADSGFAHIRFVYPDRDLGWLPDGIVGVLVTFLVASMAFAFAVIKPLKIQI
jgi:hypothetical protein